MDKLNEIIMGKDGFIVKLRCENKFDENMYSEIKDILKERINEWKASNSIPKNDFLPIIELIEFLARNSNFLSKEDSIKVEDASLEIKDMLNELE